MYLPKFDGPIKGYVVNSINANHWKMARTHDWEECMQEAYIVFLRCAAKYPMTDTPQHFMALFKRAWANQIIELAAKATKAKALVPEAVLDREDEQEWRRDPIGELDTAGTLQVMIRQAPREVLQVLNLFLNAPQELLDLAQRSWAAQGRKDPTGSEFVCQMLGLPAGADPVGEVHRYFTEH